MVKDNETPVNDAIDFMLEHCKDARWDIMEKAKRKIFGDKIWEEFGDSLIIHPPIVINKSYSPIKSPKACDCPINILLSHGCQKKEEHY